VNCSNCGAENRPEGKFCTECGAAMAATCPGCGAALAPGAKFLRRLRRTDHSRGTGGWSGGSGGRRRSAFGVGIAAVRWRGVRWPVVSAIPALGSFVGGDLQAWAGVLSRQAAVTVGDFRWTVLADPAGNEFCVSGG
jgi:hypothetical protein